MKKRPSKGCGAAVFSRSKPFSLSTPGRHGYDLINGTIRTRREPTMAWVAWLLSPPPRRVRASAQLGQTSDDNENEVSTLERSLAFSIAPHRVAQIV